MQIIKYVGIVGFFICLFIMYATPYGIRRMRKFDSGFRLLDMKFHYSTTEISETFSKLGAHGRRAYKNYWILDFFFIACFLIVQMTVVSFIDSSNTIKTSLIFLSISRALFDIVENGILIFLIDKYPIQNNQLANICSYVTTSKFLSLYLWLSGIVVMLLL